MSKTVDERVVSMEFDNKQFERGVQTSLKSLGDLKQGLDLKESARNLRSLEQAGKSFSLAGLASGIETISNRFTTLGIVGMTALQNITNSAVNAGKRMVSALTIDPIKTGFKEYETQINAVQTILANTSSKGTTLDNVNDALDTLNKYADKTIYNFTEMTRNIGTFTAAGIDLDTSVNAIQGIANLAAVSGSTSQQASTAMYQLSQALSSGTVKLQDWNSVVNAGMGGQVFQDALKETARVHSVNIDQMIKEEGSFRNTLQKGWLSADILTETLQKFTLTTEGMTDAEIAQNREMLKTKGYTEEQIDAIFKMGETATNAATKVKTFTQLFDTLKEAAQSGWTQSWETIVGDFEEAKALLTEISETIGGIINSSAEVRNNTLQGWKDLGGRMELIQALKNSFQAIMDIIAPIKKAFRDIFPPTTSKQLYDFTVKLRELTDKFKMVKDFAPQIEKVFRGIFSVLSIGKNAIFAVVKGIGKLVKSLGPASGKLLSFAASIGDWVTELGKAVEEGDIFNKAIKKISDVLTTIGGKIETSVYKIKQSIYDLTGLDLSSLDSISDSLKRSFHPFIAIGGFVSKAVSAIGGAFKKLAPIFSKVGSTIGKAVKGAGFESLIALFTGGTFVAILTGIKSFVSSLKAVSSNASGFLKSLKDLFGGVQDLVKAYENNAQAKTLQTIAISIAILAGALLLLSMIDAGSLGSALTAITTLIGELMGSMALFQKIVSGKGTKGMVKLAGMLMIFSVAVLILAAALKTMASVDMDDLAKGLLGIVVISGVLVGVAKLLEKSSGKLIGSAAALLIFAAGLRLVVSSVKAMGGMDTESLIKGILGLIAVLGTLAAFMMASKYSGLTVKDALGIVAISVALKIMANAVKTIAKIDPSRIGGALVAIGILLTELGIFVKAMGAGNNIMSTAASLVILGVAMIIFAKAVEKFGSMDFLVMNQGLLGLSVALAAITVAVRAMPKNMVGIGIGMVAMAAGMVIMAKAIETMGGMPIGQLCAGLAGLAGGLMLLVVAANAMNGTLAGAAAILVMSVALIGMAVAIKMIGALPIEDILKGLGSIAAVLAVLGVAALVMAPVVPTLLLLGAALLVVGIGLAALGAATIVLSIGLASLSVAGLAGVGILLALAAATAVLTALSPAMVVASVALTALAVGILALGLGMTLLVGALATFVALGPTGMETLVTMCETAAQIGEFAGNLALAGAALLAFGAGALVAGAGALVGGVGLLVFAIGLRAMEGIDLENLNGIDELASKLLKASLDLLLASPGLLASGGALAAFGAGAKSTGSGLQEISDGLVGIVKSLKEVPDQLKDSTKAITDGIKSIITEVTIVIRDQKSEIVAAVMEVATASEDSINGSKWKFISSGENLVNGFIIGISNKAGYAAKASAAMAASALAAANKELDIHSPSGKFEDVGKFVDLGLAKGLQKYAGIATEAAANVGEGTIRPVMTMADNLASNGKGIQGALQKMTQGTISVNPVMDTNENVTVTHKFEKLTVEGVNNKGEFVAAADYAVEEMLASMLRRQNRT